MRLPWINPHATPKIRAEVFTPALTDLKRPIQDIALCWDAIAAFGVQGLGQRTIMQGELVNIYAGFIIWILEL